MRASLVAAACILLAVAALARAGEARWRNVTAPPDLLFPRDHGSHPDFRTEWWYATGILSGDDGRRFGYQLTFFRHGLDPSAAGPQDSALRARHVLAAHLAIVELDGGALLRAQRLRREDGSFARASRADLDVVLGSWSMRRSDADHSSTIHLEAADVETGLSLSLDLRPLKPIIAHGENGLSRKGNEAGNASVYLSWTRLATSGRIRFDSRPYDVAGESWFDHEWGTTQLGEGVVGWDWFGLRLTDGRDLMLYRLRRADGGAAPHSAGTLVSPGGEARHLRPADFTMDPLDVWKSGDTGAAYPVRWRITVPSAELAFEARAGNEACELDGRSSTGVIYWEGPVRLRDLASGDPVGEGYAEFTGYASSLEGSF